MQGLGEETSSPTIIILNLVNYFVCVGGWKLFVSVIGGLNWQWFGRCMSSSPGDFSFCLHPRRGNISAPFPKPISILQLWLWCGLVSIEFGERHRSTSLDTGGLRFSLVVRSTLLIQVQVLQSQWQHNVALSIEH